METTIEAGQHWKRNRDGMKVTVVHVESNRANPWVTFRDSREDSLPGELRDIPPLPGATGSFFARAYQLTNAEA